MLYKEDWDQAKKRLLALWDGEVIDRCCISVTAPKDGKSDPSVFAVGDYNPEDPGDMKDYWENPERILKRNVKRMENTFFGGEAFPQIMLNFGPSGHAVYCGAKFHYRQNTIWYNPVITDWSSQKVRFNLEDGNLKHQLEIAAYLAESGKDRFFVSMPDISGTLDAICHLRNSSDVLMDLIEEPEAIEEAIRTINAGWKQVSEWFYRATRDCNEGGATIGWMDTWAPGRHAQMQCDMSVMFSPKTYEQFVIPDLEEEMEWNEYPLYHFDGQEQIRHLDLLLDLKKLRMIQRINVTGQPSPANFIPVFQKIQKAGKGLLIFTPAEDIPALLSELSPKGLYLHAQAASVEEAKNILSYVEKNSRA